MAIEIRELVIKTKDGANATEAGLSPLALAQIEQNVLQDCLEKVMDKLQQHLSHSR